MKREFCELSCRVLLLLKLLCNAVLLWLVSCFLLFGCILALGTLPFGFLALRLFPSLLDCLLVVAFLGFHRRLPFLSCRFSFP
jgi:hypothetical protein